MDLRAASGTPKLVSSLLHYWRMCFLIKNISSAQVPSAANLRISYFLILCPRYGIFLSLLLLIIRLKVSSFAMMGPSAGFRAFFEIASFHPSNWRCVTLRNVPVAIFILPLISFRAESLLIQFPSYLNLPNLSCTFLKIPSKWRGKIKFIFY